MVKGFIYKITCLVTDKVYIGQTIRKVENRFRSHLRNACNGSGYYLHSAIRKYGVENFVVEEIASYSAENKSELKIILDEAEKFYIQEYDSFNKGYNQTLGGEGGLGRILSDEVKEKIGRAQRGKKISEEHHRNICKAMQNLSEESKLKIIQANLGRKASPETIEKLRQSHLGHKPSEETLIKLKKAKQGFKPARETIEAARQYHLGRPMADNVKEALLKANRGRKLSEEHKKKIGEANKGEKSKCFGKKLSEETKEKIRKAHLGKRGYKHSEETKRKISEAHRLRQEKNENGRTSIK